jgi:hypothetical protein
MILHPTAVVLLYELAKHKVNHLIGAMVIVNLTHQNRLLPFPCHDMSQVVPLSSNLSSNRLIFHLARMMGFNFYFFCTHWHVGDLFAE